MDDRNENKKDAARLDILLVERGAFASRARAQGAIRAGLVRIDGSVVNRPAMMVVADADISVAGDAHDYVSRGALKLEAALAAFAVASEGRVCLDLGASTGGFSEVLLRHGASKIYAVDVGRGQLHPKIAADPRVLNLERTHARDLTRALVPDPIEIVVCDVSFISLMKALPPALALAAPGGRLVALVKPQFELGPRKIGKGGVVRASVEEYRDLIDGLSASLARAGWAIDGVIASPILGGDGNKEFVLGATRKP